MPQFFGAGDLSLNPFFLWKFWFTLLLQVFMRMNTCERGGWRKNQPVRKHDNTIKTPRVALGCFYFRDLSPFTLYRCCEYEVIIYYFMNFANIFQKLFYANIFITKNFEATICGKFFANMCYNLRIIGTKM